MIDALEKCLRDRLATLKASIVSSPLEEEGEATGTAVITVRYLSERRGALTAQGGNLIQQTASIQVQLRFKVKELRGKKRLSDLFEQAQDALAGYNPAVSAPYASAVPGLYMDSGRLMGYRDGVWDAQQLWSLPLIYTKRRD